MKKIIGFMLILVLILITSMSYADKEWTYKSGRFVGGSFCLDVPDEFAEINNESDNAIVLRSKAGDMFLAIILETASDVTLEMLESNLDTKSEGYVAGIWGVGKNDECTSRLVSSGKISRETIEYLEFSFDVVLAGEPYIAYHCLFNCKNTFKFCELKLLYPKSKTNFGKLCYDRLIESISINAAPGEDVIVNESVKENPSAILEETKVQNEKTISEPTISPAATPLSTPEITSTPDFDRSISITNEEGELWVDAQKRVKLNAVVTKLKDEAPDKTALVWSVGSEKIADVSSNGVVTGKKAGKTRITCSAKDNPDINTSVIITVRQPVTKLVSKEKTIIVHEGHAEEWRIEVQPEDASNKKLEYTASNEKISVEAFGSNGVIKGIKTGRAKATATSKSNKNKTVTCDVIIEPEVPLTVTGLGYGIYQNTLLELTVANRSEALTIINFDYELTHYDFKGNEVYSGSFTLSRNTKIKPGKEEKISIGNVYGTSQAYKTVVCITAVTYSDNSTWNIPRTVREVETFSRE